MSNPAPFEPITELLEHTLNARLVYAEPVRQGDTTVIPVARAAYGFGAGGGSGPGRPKKKNAEPTPPGDEAAPEAQGAGGGGGVVMTPVGAIEIGPLGTRFIRYRPLAPLLGAAAFGLLAGWLFARRRT